MTATAAPWVCELLRWFGNHARHLPWRDSPTPYRVWVSEIMLQQTQVRTVIPYFDRFVARFPDIAALAAVPQQDVLKLWEGLGYYSRARNMHQAARQVVATLDGRLPCTYEALRELPGLGEYTAAALAAIAFGQAVAAVDGNVLRVYARLYCMPDDISRQATRRKVQQHLQAIMPADRAGPFTEALMELGALICRPSSPLCMQCPLADVCKARRSATVTAYPVRGARTPPAEVHAVTCLVRRRARTLMVQRPAAKMLGGLWVFPGGACGPDESPETAVQRAVMEETDIRLNRLQHVGTVSHTYTHRKLRMEVFVCRDSQGRARALDCEAVRWLSSDQIAEFPLALVARKAMAL